MLEELKAALEQIDDSYDEFVISMYESAKDDEVFCTDLLKYLRDFNPNSSQVIEFWNDHFLPPYY